MKTADLITEARKQVSATEVDAFVKGAKWVMDSIHGDNVNIVLEDQLPCGAIVLERFSNGSPKLVLGPNLGSLGQSDAKKIANNGLWELPTAERIEQIYDCHTEVFEQLYRNGEECLMTSSTKQHGSWTNQVVLNCRKGYTCSTIPGWTPYPVRAILDLGRKKRNIYD